MKYIILFALVLIALFSCRKEEEFTSSSDDRLSFSVDTLRFDTVFTELGSATRFFRVFNPHDKSIRISRVALKGNTQSKFNLNVDGLPGDTHEDVIIYPKDSIYVFAEVTINPDEPLSSSPYFVYDEVIFETNGNTQTVTLEAWGQNANYIPSRYHKDSIVVYTCNDFVTWDDQKPYVIYGIVAFVDCRLEIAAGTRIHVHGGLSRTIDPTNGNSLIYNSGRLFFGDNASLRVNGTLEEPVIFEGDRLEEDFAEADGQWTGIIFSAGSEDNLITHATVKNSLFGIYVDSSAEVSLKNVQIYNTSGPGIFALHARVEAENCLIRDNGSHSVQLVYGGTYDFTYCTLANYGTDAAALSMGNGICDDPFCESGPPRINRINADFKNCIVSGSKRDEITISDFTGNRAENPLSFLYSFSHCVLRFDELTDAERGIPDFPNQCTSCTKITSQDVLFRDISENDFHLDTLSVAEGKAIPVNGILFDLEGNDRDPVAPDAGCFEYQYQ